MSSAVAELPIEKAAAEAAAYRMPEVHPGMVVLYFSASLTKETAIPALVRGVYQDQIVVTHFGSAKSPNTAAVPLDQVRHITDPRMTNPNIRKEGAWDYLPWEKAQREELAAVKAQLAKLMSDLGVKQSKMKAD